jgi:hypothetical protein
MHRPKPVISPALSEVEGTGGTALFAVPERRNSSSTSDFRLKRRLGVVANKLEWRTWLKNSA